MSKELSTYPKELTEMRSLHEMSFIMSLWKNPELYDEYINEVNPSTDLLLQDGKFYYTLGLDMHKLGYKSFDDASIFTYMNSNDELVEEFSKRGGIREVDNMRAILNEENIETYYDNLVKNNMLIKLYDKGFDVVKEIDKFNIMTTTQLYDYFEYQLDNVFLNRGAGVKIEDLSIDKDFIDSCNEGTERGFSYGSTCPILNYHTLGLHKANVQVFAGFSGTGKEQHVDAKIATPNGWKRMGDIQIGDKVFGEDGLSHTVIGIFPQGKKPSYKITFSDGTSTECGLEHLWHVQTNKLRQNSKKYNDYRYKVLTLNDIMKDYKNPSGYKYSIPITKPVEYSKKNLIINPYLLGLLLGDGSLTSKKITFSNAEEDVLKDFTNYIEMYGNTYTTRKYDNHYQVLVTNNFRIKNNIKSNLKKLNLLGCGSREKFIPKEYLFSSVHQRLELLAGLCNTDGCVRKEVSLNISTYSKKMSEDIRELVLSLGFSSTINSQDRTNDCSTSKYDKEIEYTVTIVGDLNILKPYLSKKHLSKLKDRHSEYCKSIVDIEYVGEKESQCIMIDSESHLYLTDDYIVTHNTSFVMNSYVMPILDGGEKIVIVANEMNISAWKHLFLATILSAKLKYYGISRKKQKTGGFTQEQYEWLMKAVDYYNEHYKDRIKFVKIYDYSIEDVKRVFRKMSKLGFSYGLFDTFKSENSASERVTGELIEASKQLLQVAEKEEMCIIITMQLAIHMENTRYLTGATLSTAKGVKEVVSELILMRKLWDDEFKDEKYDVKPYRLRRDPATGKITNVKEEITLDRDKKYRILFLDKTRNDEDDLAILFQFDGAWNSWKEIGYCNPRYQRN